MLATLKLLKNVGDGFLADAHALLDEADRRTADAVAMRDGCAEDHPQRAGVLSIADFRLRHADELRAKAAELSMYAQAMSLAMRAVRRDNARRRESVK